MITTFKIIATFLASVFVYNVLGMGFFANCMSLSVFALGLLWADGAFQKEA